MSAKPNILVLSDWFSPAYKAGGPIRSVAAMIELCKDDLKFQVLCRNTDWMESESLDVPESQWVESYGAEVMYLVGTPLLKILRAVMSNRDRIVYFNGIYSPVFNAIPLLVGLLLGRQRMIVSPRGMLNPNAIALKSAKKKILLTLLRLAGIERKIIFHSASSKETTHILEVFRRLDSSRIIEVPNVPAIPGARSASFENRDRYLSVGRISRVKNTDLLIEAFLKSQNEGNQLKLIGTTDDPNYYAMCETLIGEHKSVELAGGRDPEALRELYLNSGFFCLATSGENFGHAIIEALAHGCPAIISDQTPWNHLAESGAGWVVPVNDKDAWITAFRESQRVDEKKYQEMSQAAKRFVRENFQIHELRQQYLRLFA